VVFGWYSLLTIGGVEETTMLVVPVPPEWQSLQVPSPGEPVFPAFPPEFNTEKLIKTKRASKVVPKIKFFLVIYAKFEL
jgi:hypothetical protein